MKHKRIVALLLLVILLAAYNFGNVSAKVLISFENYSSHFQTVSGSTFSDGILKLGSVNQFSTTVINHNYYTVKLKATVGTYVSGTVVESCILIGSATKHHRFVLKDAGAERTQVPRKAYAKYYLYDNNVLKNETVEVYTNTNFIPGEWYDVKIVVEGTKAYFYINDLLYHIVTDANGFKGNIGFRGNGGSFKDFSVEVNSIIGSDSLSNEADFPKYFNKTDNETLTDGVLTLGKNNLMSLDEINLPQFTVTVQASVGNYVSGDIVEMCINIGNATNHQRFMIKDTGTERTLVPRNAYSKYIKIVNGVADNSTGTTEKSLGVNLVPGEYFDITIVCNGNKADMYIGGVLTQSVTVAGGISGAIGFRGNGASFKNLSVTEGLVIPGTVKHEGEQIRSRLVPFITKNGEIDMEDMRQGLRFCFDIPETGEKVSCSGTEYTVTGHGALVILKDKLTDEKHMLVENVGTYPGLMNQNELVDFTVDGKTYKSAYVYNIPETAKSRIIVAKAYIECTDSEGNTIYIYSEPHEDSVESVYLRIIGDGNEHLLDNDVKSWWRD